MKCAILVGIVLDFIKKRTLTAQWVAEKYEISTRTAYRYLDEISLYFPIFSKRGRKGGYEIIEREYKSLIG